MKNRLYVAALVVAVGMVAVFSAHPSSSTIHKISSYQEPYVLTLNSSNYSYLPTSAGTGQSTASNSPKTKNGNAITIGYSSAYRYGSYIRMTANTGYICNVSAITGIKAITVTMPQGAAKLSFGNTYGTYCDPIAITTNVRYDINNMNYFKISAGASVPAISAIKIEYSCGQSGGLDPVQQHTHNGYHYLANEPTAEKAGNLEFYACKECSYVSLTKEDSGTYVNTVLTYTLPSNHIAYLAPTLLKQPTQFSYPIPINVQVPSTSYEVDQTGASDATSAIQSALDYVGNLGGGTVYIPSGRYLIAGQLSIPNRVSLVGDFKGPDSNTDYGTVFLCTKAPDGTGSLDNNAQIVVTTNGSINGITFYYPNQNVANVTAYGPTIYVHTNPTSTLANLYFINSYDGIAVNSPTDYGGELVNIENIYGTFLNSGISGYYQSDVGFWNNINMSPSYYENALTGYRCNNTTALYRQTRTYAVGLTLGDLDDFSLNKVYIDNMKIGIFFPSEVQRPLQAFWGMLNDIHITDCLTGVYAQRVFSGCGVVFTHSQLGKVINVSNEGMLKLSKCSYSEILGTGKTMIESGSETYEAAPITDTSNTYNIPQHVCYVEDLDTSGVNDVSSALQAKLDTMTDGGVVVLKNGTYRLNNPITVPANTMITSFGASYTRSHQGEYYLELVKFISYSNDACVKLSSYAGISGIRIYNAYKDPDTAYNTLTASGTDSYVGVKGIGNNCFAINTEVSYTFTGFDFTGVSNHYMKYCYGSAYETFIKVSGGGKVINCLSNHSFVGRCNLVNFAQANTTALEKYHGFEDQSKEEYCTKSREITRTYSTMIKISGGSELAVNCFSYGIKTLIESNATLLAVNTSQDNLKDENSVFIINGGSAKVVNNLRVFGHSYTLNSGNLEIYGRLDFTVRGEKYYNSQTSSDDTPLSPISGLTEDLLTDCESTSGVSGASRNSSYKYHGSYSWRASSTSNPTIRYSFSSRDISSYMNQGYIRFYVYCSNISGKGSEITIELTSSGTYDSDEICFDLGNYVTVTGWNEIIVKLSDLYSGGGTFNPQSLNFLRFYAVSCSATYYLDYISFFHEPVSGNQIIINEAKTLTNANGMSLSDFRMQGNWSFKSNDSTNATFAYSFTSAMNVSSYMSSGYLSFYLYVPNIEWLGDYVFVELTSSGTWDVEEITCDVKPYITESGWNHVEIPLSSFYKGSDNGTFDPTALDFFRLYTLNSSSYFYLDDIRLVK